MKKISGSRRDYHLTRSSIFLLVVSLVVGMVGYGGSCVVNPPSEDIEIHDWYDLDDVRDNLGDSYILMNDLDSTTAGYEELASPTANGGKGWQPIGVWSDGLTGGFDGQGHEIRDLPIDRPDEHGVGLFARVEQSGVIINIGMTNATVIGKSLVGGLAGVNYGTVRNSYYGGNVTGSSYHHHVGGLLGGNEGTVNNSYSTGNVTGGAYVGGLVGTNTGTVTDSHSSSIVTASNEVVGGLVGMNAEGTVNNSYSTGNVTGNLGVGGLVGANGVSGPGTVTNCYSTGSVIGENYVGGLVGSNEGGSVSYSYSTSGVSGNLSVGGLVGGNSAGTVTDSYSTGNVTGVDNVGGLVGENEGGSVSNSFWDTQTSGQATSDGGTGKTTAEMQDIATFSGAAWNITAVANPSTRNPAYIWNIVDDETYPFLS
jgi:hypothetical protein